MELEGEKNQLKRSKVQKELRLMRRILISTMRLKLLMITVVESMISINVTSHSVFSSKHQSCATSAKCSSCIMYGRLRQNGMLD